MYFYINVFLFYSIFGNMFERFITSIRHIDYTSGFMGTIFTPVYGVAMLVIIYIHNKIRINNKFFKILLEIIIYGVVLSLLEFVGGIMIENTFNKVFWNYERFKFNIGKYISLETAVLWGIMSVVILYLIHPLFKKIEKHIPRFLTLLVSVFFVINLIYVFIVKLT